MTVSTEISLADLDLRPVGEPRIEPGLTHTVDITLYEVLAGGEVIGHMAERFNHRHRSKSGSRTWYVASAEGVLNNDTMMTTRTGAMNELLKRLA